MVKHCETCSCWQGICVSCDKHLDSEIIEATYGYGSPLDGRSFKVCSVECLLKHKRK